MHDPDSGDHVIHPVGNRTALAVTKEYQASKQENAKEHSEEYEASSSRNVERESSAGMF